MTDIEKVKTGIFDMLQRHTWKDIDHERHRFQPVLNDVLKLLKEQQPKKGHWETKIIRGDKAMCCSVCGEDSGTIYDYPFCPNCGAYMGEDGEQE